MFVAIMVSLGFPTLIRLRRSSERGLSAGFPLGGQLMMTVHAAHADTVRDPDFLEEFEIRMDDRGKPHIEVCVRRANAPCPDADRRRQTVLERGIHQYVLVMPKPNLNSVPFATLPTLIFLFLVLRVFVRYVGPQKMTWTNNCILYYPCVRFRFHPVM